MAQSPCRPTEFKAGEGRSPSLIVLKRTPDPK
jgi:hypothetical protein